MGLTMPKEHLQGLTMDSTALGGLWRCPWYPKDLISSPLSFLFPPDIYYFTHSTASLVSPLSLLPSLTTLYRPIAMPLVFYKSPYNIIIAYDSVFLTICAL